DFTSDKLRSLIEAHVDVKTTDGRTTQVKKTTYAQSSQVHEIRKSKMFEIMTREALSCDLKELVQKFIP
ncbi:hypothetical protein DFH11DRAFT_1513324, partial [Phellopilus nigrolimitatus]